MPSKGNPYPSREPSPGQEPSLPHNNETHHSNPYSGGDFLKRTFKDLIVGPGVPKHTKSEVEKPAEPKSIFEKRKEGAHPDELKSALKKLTQFQTKMDAKQRLSLADELIKEYGNTKPKEAILHKKILGKEASLGETDADRKLAAHEKKAIEILEKGRP